MATVDGWVVAAALPGLPERVVLEPVPAVAVGESRNLTCRVLEVAPVGNLTVTLRRGAETLRTESFGAAEGSASVAVSHLLTAGPGDHGQDVTCHAELSLRPHGPLFARAAVPAKLSVFGESLPHGRAPESVLPCPRPSPRPSLSRSLWDWPTECQDSHPLCPLCRAKSFPTLVRGCTGIPAPGVETSPPPSWRLHILTRAR